MRLRALPIALLLPLLGVATPTPATAQELSARTTQRTLRAAVQVIVQGPRGQRAAGSGTIVDARGYILTNFHVVGHMHPGQGAAPGTLLDPRNRIRIALVSTARETAEPAYLAEVVRGDVRLDLALLRIVSDLRGNPIGNRRFPTVPIANASRLRPGTRLFAFGYPLGVRTIHVTSGEMSGFQMNSRDEVAWIRTDAEFNPGNSGGMLVDRRGRLVAVPTAVFSGRGTLEPIEVARPVERVPREWWQSLRRGHIDDMVIDGVRAIPFDGEVEDEAVGDGGAMDRPEMHYYELPRERPLRVEVSPGLSMGLLRPDGRVMREGRGNLVVGPDDPADAMLAVLIPSRAESGGGALNIRIRSRPARTGMPGWNDLPPPGAVSRRGPAPAPVGVPPAPIALGTAAPTPPSPAGAGEVAVRGRLVDASTGQPLAGTVALAPPGFDLEAHGARFLAGSVDGSAFEAPLTVVAEAGADGRYELPRVPAGTHRVVGLVQGYRPALLDVRVRAEGGRARLHVAPLQLVPVP